MKMFIEYTNAHKIIVPVAPSIPIRCGQDNIGGVVEKTLFDRQQIHPKGRNRKNGIHIKRKGDTYKEREKHTQKERITLKDGKGGYGVHGRDEGAKGEALHKVQLVDNVRKSQ